MTVRQFAAASLVFWLLTLPAVFLELRPFLEGGATREARVAAIGRGGNSPGLSTFSQQLSLDNCLEAINSVYGRLQPGEERQKTMKRCADIAAEITAFSPSNSYGWFVGALAVSELGKTGDMNFMLGRSQMTGPTEEWIAELRVGLGESRLAELNEAIRGGHENDLKLLAQSAKGVASIARRYFSQDDFRSRITALVESLPADEQARFVGYVRRSVAIDGK